MKSTVVDESLSTMQQLFCFWEDQLATRLIQQNVKSTQDSLGNVGNYKTINRR